MFDVEQMQLAELRKQLHEQAEKLEQALAAAAAAASSSSGSYRSYHQRSAPLFDEDFLGGGGAGEDEDEIGGGGGGAGLDNGSSPMQSSGDLAAFMRMRKELRRLSEDNKHLFDENRQMLDKLRAYEAAATAASAAFATQAVSSVFDAHQTQQNDSSITIRELEKEILVSFKSTF